jgi:hypothetical protein
MGDQRLEGDAQHTGRDRAAAQDEIMREKALAFEVGEVLPGPRSGRSD